MSDNYQPNDPQAASIVAGLDDIIADLKQAITANVDNSDAHAQAVAAVARREAEYEAHKHELIPWKAGQGKAGRK